MANDKWKIVLRSPAQSPSIRPDLESQSQFPAALSDYRQTYRFLTRFSLRSDRVRCGRAPDRAWALCGRCYADDCIPGCIDRLFLFAKPERMRENESRDSFPLLPGHAGLHPIVQRSAQLCSCVLPARLAKQILSPTHRVFLLPDLRTFAPPQKYSTAAACVPPAVSITDLPACAVLCCADRHW